MAFNATLKIWLRCSDYRSCWRWVRTSDLGSCLLLAKHRWNLREPPLKPPCEWSKIHRLLRNYLFRSCRMAAWTNTLAKGSSINYVVKRRSWLRWKHLCLNHFINKLYKGEKSDLKNSNMGSLIFGWRSLWMILNSMKTLMNEGYCCPCPLVIVYE